MRVLFLSNGPPREALTKAVTDAGHEAVTGASVPAEGAAGFDLIVLDGDRANPETVSEIDAARAGSQGWLLCLCEAERAPKLYSAGADDCLPADATRRDFALRLGAAERAMVRAARESGMAAVATRYRAIAETGPIGMFEVRADGIVLFANPAITLAAGLGSPDDLIGRNILDFYADPKQRQELFAALAETGAVTAFPVRMRQVDGQERHLLLSATLNAGVLRGLSVDVTDQHRALEDLKRSEELTTRILETMPGGIVHVGLDGSVLRANAEALRILGLRLDELTRRYIGDFETETLHEDGSPCPVEDYPVARALMTGQPQPPVTIGVRRPDGHTSWAVFSAAPVHDPQTGNTNGAVVTFIDITARRAAERALSESEARYRELVEASPDPIAIVSDERLVFLNAAGVRLLDLSSPDDLVGKGVLDLVPEAHRARLRAFVRQRADRESQPAYEERLLRRDGSAIEVELSAAPLVFGGERAVLLVARDLRPRKQAQEQLDRLRAQMQHTQKLESLGVLAGGIAHDFNNLLAAILGNAGLAKIHLAPDAPALRYVAQLERAAEQAADLTGQMLAYSGRGKFTTELIDLSNLAEEMSGLLSTVVSKRATLTTRLEHRLPAVRGDVSQLRQVVMNLIMNASEALDDAPGTVTLRTGLAELSADELSATYVDDKLPAGAYVYLEVADDGRGMTRDTVAKVFDPFFTTKTTGRGLGMAATLGIVRGHHGAVTLETTPGQGTRFRLYFPVAATEERPADAEETVDPSVGDATVLVIDDEKMVRDVTSTLLREFGYTVTAAASGERGLQVFAEQPDAFDVVLLDMTMPDMHGNEVLVELKRLRPGVRVILCSGYSEEDVAERVGAGAALFLQKPFSATALVRKIQEALG